MHNKCRECKKEQPVQNFYRQKRNTSSYENICKDCKRIKSAAKRYNVSDDIIRQLYTNTNCNCCGIKFKDRKLTHIHHVGDHIRGIICFSCNYILGQENSEDHQRITSCLEFMHRNNLLYTVNPQERPIDTDVMPESSETTRCETLYCKQCKRTDLQKSDFHKTGKSRKPRRVCRKCWNSSWRLRNRFKSKRQNAKICQCCSTKFTKKNKSCVHHIGDTVIGIICNRCNQVLGNESESRRNQLLACLEFMI